MSRGSAGEPGAWGTWSYITLWMTGIHSVPGYVFVVSLVALGHGIVTNLVGTALGAMVLAAVCCVTGLTGLCTGLTFPDTIEWAYGPAAARFASALRGVVAIGWYGVQTYLAAAMVAACIGSLTGTPAAAAPAGTHLGMTSLQWGVFVGLSLAQVALLASGRGAVRRLAGLAGPVIWLCLVVLVVRQGSLAPFPAVGSDATLRPAAVLEVAMLTVAFLGGPAVNYADFGRLAASRNGLLAGTAVGVVGNVVVFFVVTAMIGARYPAGGGEPFSAIIVGHGPVLGLVLTVVLGLCTVGANVVLNFVSATYDLLKVIGDRIGRRDAVVVVGLAAALSCPGLWYSSSSAVVEFVTAVGAALGPLAGVLIVLLVALRRGAVLTPRDFWVPLAVGAAAEALAWLATATGTAASAAGSVAWLVGAAAGAATGLVRTRRAPAGMPAAPAHEPLGR